jgi:exosortase
MAAAIPHASEAATPMVNWRRFGALAVIVLGIPLLYWPAARSLADVWLDTGRTTYTHGFAIFAVTCWLLWRKREALSADRVPDDARFAVWWMACLAVSVLAWQLMYRAGVSIGIEVLLPAIIWFAIGAFFGTRAAQIAWFPMAYLVFALTLWDVINPLLQGATVQAVRVLLTLFGVPAYFEGDVVHIPAGNFEIQGGCSGLHFMIVALSIAALMGELRGDGWRRRAQWLLLAGVLALLVNWLRVATIILAGHLTHMQSYVVRESHYGYGWVLFAAAMLAFFLIERRVPLAAAPRCDARPPARAPRVPLAPTVATALVICLPLLMNAAIARNLSDLPRTVSPAAGHSWRAVDPDLESWAPHQLNGDQTDRAAFMRGDSRVERQIVVYREQRTGKKMGGYASRPQGDAQVLDRAGIQVGEQRFAALTIEAAGRRSLLWVNYRVADRGFDDSTRAQLWYGFNTFALRSPVSRVIAFWSPCEPDCDAADRAIRQFIDEGELQ